MRPGRGMAVALACGLGAACFAHGTEAAAPVAALAAPGAAPVASPVAEPEPVPVPVPVSVAAGPQPLPALPSLRPVGLSIPAIGVSEQVLVPLHRMPSGGLEVPVDFARAGWFADGVPPGGPGPAVLAGHVDSREGPAVFVRLRELRPGDAVDVALSDGTVAGFAVDEVQRHPKGAFPTAAVYGPVPGSALRLITCGGAFDAGAGSYRDNVVVFASPR